MEAFTRYMQEEQPVKPANILNIVATNQGKRPLTMETPVADPLSPEQVKELLDQGHIVVDARSEAAFGAEHIPGAFNVQLSSPEFEQRVGWVTPLDVPIVLVTETPEEAQRAIYNMAFIALDSRVVGYLDGGMDAWVQAGYPVMELAQMDVHTLHHRLSTNGLKVLDVRDTSEWDDGHIEGALYMSFKEMPARLDELALTPEDSIALICATGKRSSTAGSFLQRHGYRKLYNVIGGMTAWANAHYPMVDVTGCVIQR